MNNNILYRLRSGKPSKLCYFVSNILKMMIPNYFYRVRLEKNISQLDQRSDKAYIEERVNYYNKLSGKIYPIPQEIYIENKFRYLMFRGKLSDYKMSSFHKAYFFDARDFTRWFNQNLWWQYCPGDVYFTPDSPTIVKSRLLTEDNQNSVVMKLDKLRHFMFVNDKIPFTAKKDMVIFRGKIRKSRTRTKFLKMYVGHPMCDCGVIGDIEGLPLEWKTGKKTIRQHLEYKFIMALEGNDVASNLKWVMSSNSIAVMTRPTCETWFMEGKLIPDYHYIEIKDDLSNLEEKLTYYITHIEEAQRIIDHAHEYVKQFQNKKRERLISLLVLDKYFKATGQEGLYRKQRRN